MSLIVFLTNICKRAGLKFQQQIFPQPNKNSYGSLPSGPFAVGNVCFPGKATVCFGIQVFEIRVSSVFYLLRVIITSVVREGKDTVMEVKEEEGTIKTAVIEVESSPSPDGTPIRPIFCLNKTNVENLRKLEETEDCFILDFDPSEIDTSIRRFSTLSVYSFSDDDGDGGDLSVVAEKGQVACRDYPHSRHLCIKFPFDKTPHESYCELCYCYVCDCAAPCKDWKDSESAHCNASEKIGDWKEQRWLKRKEEIKLPNS